MNRLSFIVSLYRFTTPAPFTAGQTITAGQADALNDLRMAIVKERAEKIVEEYLKKTDVLSRNDLAEIQEDLDNMGVVFHEKTRRDRLSAMEQEEREVRRDMPTAGEEEVGEEARRRVRARMKMSVKDIIGPL